MWVAIVRNGQPFPTIPLALAATPLGCWAAYAYVGEPGRGGWAALGTVGALLGGAVVGGAAYAAWVARDVHDLAAGRAR